MKTATTFDNPLAAVALLVISVSGTSVQAAGIHAVDFNGVQSAVYGDANTADCASTSTGLCFGQDGVWVGVVGDPTDAGAHFHRQGGSLDREAQYHPDSTGLYVRLQDNSKFSLQNIWVNVVPGFPGGSFVLYGYENAVNDPLLSNAGSPNPRDPEGGLVTPVASYLIPNDGAFRGNITLAELLAVDPDWGNIGAFWLTFLGFNHSPTTNYLPDPVTGLTPYPDWDARIDDIVLGNPVPLPAAIWLFGSAIAALCKTGRDSRLNHRELTRKGL